MWGTLSYSQVMQGTSNYFRIKRGISNYAGYLRLYWNYFVHRHVTFYYLFYFSPKQTTYFDFVAINLDGIIIFYVSKCSFSNNKHKCHIAIRRLLAHYWPFQKFSLIHIFFLLKKFIFSLSFNSLGFLEISISIFWPLISPPPPSNSNSISFFLLPFFSFYSS